MARGIWKGTLGFGLVSIGVELFSADASGGLELSMLDKRDHSPIGYKKYNKRTGEEITSDEVVKGYEVSKGRFVILSNEDLKAANPHATGTIDVIGFVPASDIELAYFDTPYIVGPLKGSEKAYTLFARALQDTERVGIAQVVIRTKQHVAAVYPFRGAIVVQIVRYDSELRKPTDVGIDEELSTRHAVRPQELAMAQQLVESMATDWEPSAFHDSYRDDLMRLIEQRAGGTDGQGVVNAPAGPTPRVLDLMAALKGSLAAQKKGGSRAATSRTATSRATVTPLRVSKTDRKAAASVRPMKSAKSARTAKIEKVAKPDKPAKTTTKRRAARKSA